MKKKLPIGIQSFVNLISGGYAYVDKTPFIAELANTGKVYFLSRPRRFGKSLLVDTINCAFSGKRELFKGLYLDTPESGWNWEETNPVVKISFGQRTNKNCDELLENITRILEINANEYGVEMSSSKSPAFQLSDLICNLHTKYKNKVVVLIDEYDKPILDIIENTDVALKIREELKSFYSPLKELDEYLRFVFLTGVSKFSMSVASSSHPDFATDRKPSRHFITGIFSGLNNLYDITLSKKFSGLCGYTQSELEDTFLDYLIDVNKDDIRQWYNGYSWSGKTVYNPFDILLFFKEKTYRSYWFETGTPTFLVKLWKEKPRNPAEYDGMIVGEESLSSFEIGNILPETLLFQSGYLTIRRTIQIVDALMYEVGFPNKEVRMAFNTLLLSQVTDESSIGNLKYDISIVLDRGDTDALRQRMQSFLASIPHDVHRKNKIAYYEGYWATVIYTLFAGMGYDVIPEDVTNCGRIDLTLRTVTGIWIFEYKVISVDKSSDISPLAQIKNKNYAEKYNCLIGKNGNILPVFQIGIVFDPSTRNINSWEVERAN